jgi:S-formylglutathione hydrolase FrmB
MCISWYYNIYTTPVFTKPPSMQNSIKQFLIARGRTHTHENVYRPQKADGEERN